MFNACSLKGNSFEDVTYRTVDEWLRGVVKANSVEAELYKLKPEQIIEKYFAALDSKDAKAAAYCISKSTLMGGLTTNISNQELFTKRVGLPLTDIDIETEGYFSNLESAVLLNIELLDEVDAKIKTYRVTMNLQYNQDFTVGSGEQFWDCKMVYESDRTGWKIEGFGH